MHMLQIILADRESAIPLWFDDHASAQKAADRLFDKGQTIDDFGHHVAVRHPIAAVLIIDVEREHEAQSEMALSHARAQAAAQTKAHADPKLRFLAAQQPGTSRLIG